MSEDTKPPESLTARLVRSEALTPEVTRMEFEVIDQPSFDFRPGQYICMMRQQQGEVARRYYSIASAPDGAGGKFPAAGAAAKVGFSGSWNGHCADSRHAAAPFRRRERSSRTSADDADIWRTDAAVLILSGRV